MTPNPDDEPDVVLDVEGAEGELHQVRIPGELWARVNQAAEHSGHTWEQALELGLRAVLANERSLDE